MSNARDLLRQGSQRLTKAKDADKDPAAVPALAQSPNGSGPASGSESPDDAQNASGKDGYNASVEAITSDSDKASVYASGKSASRAQLGLPPRRRGRPVGPRRVMLNVRVLLATDQLVTEIGTATGMGPQDIADAAIAHYAAYLHRTGKLPKQPDRSATPGG